MYFTFHMYMYMQYKCDTLSFLKKTYDYEFVTTKSIATMKYTIHDKIISKIKI